MAQLRANNSGSSSKMSKVGKQGWFPLGMNKTDLTTVDKAGLSYNMTEAALAAGG